MHNGMLSYLTIPFFNVYFKTLKLSISAYNPHFHFMRFLLAFVCSNDLFFIFYFLTRLLYALTKNFIWIYFLFKINLYYIHQNHTYILKINHLTHTLLPITRDLNYKFTHKICDLLPLLCLTRLELEISWLSHTHFSNTVGLLTVWFLFEFFTFDFKKNLPALHL